MFSAKKQSDLFLNKLFANVDKKKVKFKFTSDKIKTYKEGDIVFKKGDKSNNIYLILEGEVKLKIPNPPFAPKIQFKYQNDFFGEKELLENNERETSCVAEKDSQLYLITITELQKLIDSNKTVKDNLEMVTISTVGKTLKEITQESTKEKTEKKIDYSKAIKVHPDKPITGIYTKKTDEKEITIDNVFITDENEIKNETEEIISEELPEKIKTKEELSKDEPVKETTEKAEEVKPITDSTKEEIKTTEENVTTEKTVEKETELETKEITEEIKDETIEEEEENKIDEKYLQIIDASNSILLKPDIGSLTEEVIKQSMELVDADRCVFFFINEEDKMLNAKINNDEELPIDLKMPMANSIAGLCALRNKLAIIDDVSDDDRFNPIYDEVFNYKTKNLLIVPIADNEENVVAVLELINSNEEKFTEIDAEVLRIFSKSISLALQNCNNINSLLHTKEEKSLESVSNYIYNDIKNPLLTIKHYAKILIKDKVPEEIKQVLQLIIKQTDFVDSLNENISSLADDKTSVKLKVFPFKETIDDILGLLAEYSESRNVEMYKKIEVDAKVKLDPKNFMVACYQIIKNACDAQPNKGSVYITSTIVDDNVLIEFKDSGEGVPKNTHEEIFSRHISLDDEDHLGVGLNIADRIIKDHGGQLTVSDSAEVGAVFTVSLPIVKE